MKESLDEHISEPKVANVSAEPTLTPELFERMTGNTDAVILVAFATGATPERLNGVIAKRTQEGIPVFLVSNNPGDQTGIRALKYDTQVKAVDAGAIPIRSINVNRLGELNEAINEELRKGVRGEELGKVIGSRFS